MKTRNIFKTLAMAMLMPAMLLTTACSNEDDLLNTESTVNKGYTLPVTVSVTRQGDATGTRASYNSETKKLEFSTGDKLFVSGNNATAGQYAGTLGYVSGGTFSGTITTKNEYTGNTDDLLAGSSATLLPKDYEDYGFLSIDDNETPEVYYDDEVYYDWENDFALTKAEAVKQLSDECGEYTSGTGFELKPENAILNFTINGLAASTSYDVSFDDDYDDTYGTVTTDGGGTATFAIGVYVDEEYGTDLKDCTLTVGGNAITLVSVSKKLEAGKIYNITKSAAPATSKELSAVTTSEVGWRIGSDGKAYSATGALPTGVTAVAMIAYVGNASDCTNGLAIALEDVSSNTLTWNNTGSNNGGKTAAELCSAWNTSKAVTGGTWRLPSAKDWQYMFIGCGSGDSYSEPSSGMTRSYSGLASKLSTAGGTALQPGIYWSSTEGSSNLFAWDLGFGNSDAEFDYGSKTNDYLVRACLAF